MTDVRPSQAPPPPARVHSARTEANTRLTSLAGMVLFVVLAAEGITIVRIHQLIAWHVAIGLALLAPVVLKLGSTGWRFLRYYTGDPEYGRAGPPQPLLRILAPFVVLTTVAVFASGIGLLVVRPGPGSSLVQIHKLSFVLWFAVTTVHVLAYITPAVQRTLADVAGRGPAPVVATRLGRQLLIGGSLVAAVILGLAGWSWGHSWVVWFGSARHGR